MKFTHYGNLADLNFPKVSTQPCPFCGTLHPIVVYGFVNDMYESDKNRQCPDKGYSFCNCKNIYYTNWSNMDTTIYDDRYANKYDTDTVKTLQTNLYCEYAPFFEGYGKFVDVGCITDFIMDAAKKDGYDPIGVDVIKRNSKHEIINGNFENVVKTLDNVSIMWMSHVLEHLRYPLEALQNVYNSIKSGGYLFLALPDPFFIDYKNTGRWGHWHIKEHHIFFEITTLCEILKGLGFSIITAKHNIEERFICNYDMHIVARKK